MTSEFGFGVRSGTGSRYEKFEGETVEAREGGRLNLGTKVGVGRLPHC